MRKIGFYSQGWLLEPTFNYNEVAIFIVGLDDEGMVAASTPNGNGIFGDHSPLTALEVEAFQNCSSNK